MPQVLPLADGTSGRPECQNDPARYYYPDLVQIENQRNNPVPIVVTFYLLGNTFDVQYVVNARDTLHVWYAFHTIQSIAFPTSIPSTIVARYPFDSRTLRDCSVPLRRIGDYQYLYPNNMVQRYILFGQQ